MKTYTSGFYKNLMENSPVAIVFLDINGVVITCNPAFTTLFSYSVHEAVGVHIDELVADASVIAEAKSYTDRIIDGNEAVRATGWRKTKSGRFVEVEIQGVPITEEHERGVLVLYNDITEQMKAQRNAENVYSSFSTILDSLDADVYVSDMDTFEVLFMNDHMRNSFGGDLTGKICHKAFHHEDKPCAHCSNARLVDENGKPAGANVWEGENPITGAWYRIYNRAIPWDDGRTVHLQIAFDITDLKAAEASLAYAATHDPLTGLPNRLVFHDRLSHAISVEKRGTGQIGVLFIDLDGFKAVNDRLGHASGDELLKELSAKMAQAVRECDTIARISGDEFAVVLEKLNNTAIAELVANRILRAISDPVSLEAGTASVTASIGAAMYPGDGASADELIRLADEAMYEIKNNGKNGVCLARSEKNRAQHEG